MTTAKTRLQPRRFDHGLCYALITPARNEAKYIERTIQSVLAQTVRPVKWVIVSDGSTDGTDEIVRRYAAGCDWIELLRLPERSERHFAAKVNAFNAGHARLAGIAYDLLGNLDADISFDAEYFEFLLEKFTKNPRLGLGGTKFTEDGTEYDFRFASTEHVSGQMQLFRRECFEQIGGYQPVEGGGIDVIAVWSARARGWQTRTYIEKVFRHHRTMGTAKYGKLRAKFKDGQKDYALGVHPLWEVGRAVFQMRNPPRVLGGCALGVGYVWSFACRRHRPMPPELLRLRRADQMHRLRLIARRMLAPRPAP
jgi:biofilm PGA synthesis N-glycosyltransferase PgaC